MTARRGRPRVLTAKMVVTISSRREAGVPHALIAAELGISIGTSRFGAWVSRHPDPLRQARLQFTDGQPRPRMGSGVAPASSSGEAPA